MGQNITFNLFSDILTVKKSDYEDEKSLHCLEICYN